MKRSKIYACVQILALALLSSSCVSYLNEEPGKQECLQNETSRMKLHLIESAASKSSIAPEENAVRDLYVMVYQKSNGRLMAIAEGNSAEDIELELIAGEYNIYVTANMKGFEAPPDEKDMKSFCYEISSFSDIEKGLPMCWSGSATMKAGELTTVSAQLSRLVSKVEFSIETGILEDLDITSVQLRQGACNLRPFMAGGSKALSTDDTMDGDFASDEDIRKLTYGESMHFYVTENCQGKLLEGNTDPWDKVPANIGDAAGLCSYIEMTGTWNENSIYEGTITYRFYLGEDATSDFNVRRNTIHNLTLYLEEDNFGRVSWKIDTDHMEYAQWEAEASFRNNFHTPDNFYITEKILIELTLDEKGQKYWKKMGSGFSLTGRDSQGNTIISFNDVTDFGEGRFEAMGTCMAAGDYEVLMVNNQSGEVEYNLGSGTVHVPCIAASYDDTFTDNIVDGFEDVSQFDINGSYQDICLYLTDDEGYNLNQGHFYGCDLSLCKWDTSIINEAFGHDLSGNTIIETTYGECMDDSYAVMYRIIFENEGTDNTWNRVLTESLGNGVLELCAKETFSGAESSHRLGLYCEDIYITLRQVPYSEIHAGTEFMYVVDNPSNLPLMIRGLKLNTMRTDVTLEDFLMPVLCSPIEGMTETRPLVVTRMPYTYCSLDSNASYSLKYNGLPAYAANEDGIEEYDIPDQTAMFHTFDVSLPYRTTGWVPKINGSYKLDTIIYGDGYGAYMNCGVIFYSYNSRQEIYDALNGASVDFRNYGELLSKDAIDNFNDITELSLSINEDNELIATSSADVELTITVSGYLKGRTRCVSVDETTYDIWGEHFEGGCRFTNTDTFTIGPDGTAIDNSGIAESFEKIREFEYYSKLNAETSDDFRTDDGLSTTLREYLKPYALELDINITSPDGTPVALTGFSGKAYYSFELEDRVTWRLGSSRVVTIIPSAFSSFDNEVGGLGGYNFASEEIYLAPSVTYNTQNLYHF